MTAGVGSTIDVLHVDDEPDFGDMAAAFLKREDDRITVETALSASEGLAKLTEASFDCIVSDYDMPEQNGIEFLETIRHEYPDLPFILFTGKGSEEIASHAISAGVTDYLQKTGNTDQYTVLANRIRNTVEGYRAHQIAEESERQLRRVYERITDGFFAVNSDWEYVYINEEGARLTDRTVDELVGSSVWQAFPGLIDSPFEDALRTAMAEQESVSIEEYFPPDESWYDVRVYGAEEGISIYFQDVTEEVERRRELKDISERFELAIEETGTGVWEWKLETDELFWDEELLGRLGLTPGDFSGSIDFFEDRLHPDDEQRVSEQIERSLETGSPYRVEQRIRHNDGTWVWFDVRGQVVSDSGSARMVGIGVDISERKEREQEIAQLKEFYETMLANIRDTVLVTDETGRFTYICPNVEFIFGYDREEVDELGTIQSLLDGSQVDTEEVQARREIHNLETSVENKAGQRRDLLITVIAVDIEDGRLLYSIRDITDRKESESDLERYATIVEALADPVYALDEGGHYTFVNEAFIEHIGYSREEIIGEHVSKILSEEDVERGRTIIRSLLGKDHRTATWEMTRITADGERIPSENHLALLPLGKDGEFRGTAGVVRDLTERKEREQQLERQNERLDEFASIVAHDLRNPLNVAQGRLELGREECSSEHLKAVAKAQERMELLIQDMLTLAREGEEVTETGPIELDRIIEDCWQNVDTADASMVTETNCTIHADRSRFAQLFENLFRNAIEHGGDNVTIIIGKLEDGFYVEDDGPGIPEAEQDDVFDAGYSTGAEGTGFGLSIVKQVAQAHGWKVRVTAGSDGGARFEFTAVEFTCK